MGRCARRDRDVLLDLRPLRVVHVGSHQPVPGAALDRLVRRRRVRSAAARPGAQPASHPRLARRARGSDDRAARVLLPVAATRERRRRRFGARRRAGPGRAARRAGGARGRRRRACPRHAARRGATRGRCRRSASACRRPTTARRASSTSWSSARGTRRGWRSRSNRRGAGRATFRSAWPGKPVSVPFDLTCFKELTITSGNASTPASWDRALELIEQRQVDLGAAALGGGAARASGSRRSPQRVPARASSTCSSPDPLVAELARTSAPQA